MFQAQPELSCKITKSIFVICPVKKKFLGSVIPVEQVRPSSSVHVTLNGERNPAGFWTNFVNSRCCVLMTLVFTILGCVNVVQIWRDKLTWLQFFFNFFQFGQLISFCFGYFIENVSNFLDVESNMWLIWSEYILKMRKKVIEIFFTHILPWFLLPPRTLSANMQFSSTFRKTVSGSLIPVLI